MPFDFFNPDDKLEMPSNSIAFTQSALEQVGEKHEKFINFLLRKNPRLCVHIEPLFELYDKESLVDNIAMRYSKKRGYLQNYLTEIQKLEEEGKAKIIEVRRLFSGGLYHESSLLVWKPISL